MGLGCSWSVSNAVRLWSPIRGEPCLDQMPFSLYVTLTDVLHRLLNQSRLLLSSTSRPSSPPLSLYQTFVLEEKHGFNKTTPSLYLVDILKSWGLRFTLGAPFWVLSYSCSSGRAIDFLSFQLIMVFLYPIVIQPFFNKHSPLKDGDLRTRIESLVSKLNFPLKHLYEIDGSRWSSHSNAYFFGLPWVCGLLSS